MRSAGRSIAGWIFKWIDRLLSVIVGWFFTAALKMHWIEGIY